VLFPNIIDNKSFPGQIQIVWFSLALLSFSPSRCQEQCPATGFSVLPKKRGIPSLLKDKIPLYIHFCPRQAQATASVNAPLPE